jgi:hypothetical protein
LTIASDLPELSSCKTHPVAAGKQDRFARYSEFGTMGFRENESPELPAVRYAMSWGSIVAATLRWKTLWPSPA